ncbi:uncharacterized protein LOC144549404 isoform X3 [Carex rostrata]
MGKKKLKAPVRVQLVFADRHLLTKELRSQEFQGTRRIWAAIRPEFATVADFARDISNRFGLRCSSIDDLVLEIDGDPLPPFEPTSLFEDNDIISVSQKIGQGKKKAVAIPDEEREIEGNKINEKQTVLSNNGILLIENGENASQKKKINKKKKKKKKRALTEVIGTEREHKEMESPEESKKKKLKLTANERPVTIEASCQNNTINQETNVPVTASERNKEVNCTSQNTCSEHRGGQEKSMMLHNFKDKFEMAKDSHGAIQGNGIGAGLSTGQENGPRTDKITAGSSPWRPRSNLDGPNAPSPSNMQKSWIQSDGQKEKTSQAKINNSVSTDEVEESDDEDDIDFDSFYPLTCLPTEGDIIAYRLVETFGRPELSFFRVGKVIKFDPITMRILLGPVSEYPIFPDGEISESQRSLYKEDGTLEIDFGSLVDLRLVEESESGKGYGKSKVTTWENETGSHSAWKTTGTCNANEETKTNWGAWAPSTSRDGASWRGRGQRGSRIQSCSGSRGRNGGIHKNVNSAWQTGGPSNANEATNYCQAPWGMNNSRYGTSNPRRGQNGNRFGARGSFSRGMNDRAGNNDNSAWEANTEATNGNKPQTQENGWDTWQPNPSRPGASWSYRGSGGGFSRGTRRGRGGRYSNPKFNK